MFESKKVHSNYAQDCLAYLCDSIVVCEMKELIDEFSVDYVMEFYLTRNHRVSRSALKFEKNSFAIMVQKRYDKHLHSRQSD